MEYKLHGNITFKDFVQFNKYHNRHGYAFLLRLAVFPAFLIILAVSLSPSYGYLNDLFRYNLSDFLKVCSPIGFFIIFMVLFFTVIMPLRQKKSYNANKDLHQPFNITINEQCISITSEAGRDTLTKEGINKIYYDKDAIYIYFGQNMARIIKKRFLENEDDFEGLVNFVKVHYGKSEKK